MGRMNALVMIEVEDGHIFIDVETTANDRLCGLYQKEARFAAGLTAWAAISFARGWWWIQSCNPPRINKTPPQVKATNAAQNIGPITQTE
jgi:hypothetical protein